MQRKNLLIEIPRRMCAKKFFCDCLKKKETLAFELLCWTFSAGAERNSQAKRSEIDQRNWEILFPAQKVHENQQRTLLSENKERLQL